MATKFFHILSMYQLYQVTIAAGNENCQELSLVNCSHFGCYYQYPESNHVGYQQAKDMCKCNGLKMATAKNREVMESINSFGLDFDFWMDLERKGLPEFTFVQSNLLKNIRDPDDPIHKKLTIGEENHVCVYIRVPRGRGKIKFVADQCTDYRMSLCQPDATCRGPHCQVLTHNSTHTTWYRHRYNCRINSGDLAFSSSERSLEDNVFASGIREGEYWIGLHKEEWKWGDGTEMIYNNWDYLAGQPSTVAEKCVISKAERHSTWIDLRCSERSGVFCFEESSSAGDIPRYIPRPTHKSAHGTIPTTVQNAPAGRFPQAVIYALVGVSCACGILILILIIVLIRSCCRRPRFSKRQRSVRSPHAPDYCEIDDATVMSYHARPRTQTCSSDAPLDGGTYDSGAYMEPISYSAQAGEPIYSVIDYDTRKDSKDLGSRYLTLI